MTYDLNSYGRGPRSVLTAQDERRIREIVRQEIAQTTATVRIDSQELARVIAEAFEVGRERERQVCSVPGCHAPTAPGRMVCGEHFISRKDAQP